MDYAFEYIVKNGGLRKEENYPYSMEEGTCETQKDDSEMVNISGHQNVPRNDDKSLLKALAHQPLSIAIDASGREFQFYKGPNDIVSDLRSLTLYYVIKYHW
ncbi:hypothetical protein Bca52824_063458 [Brassica carinata]|uniref:Peptidase C1A papain C-terminal domain-containing protein n=1 Tax=Brassica carinata TaxID=52824 RepID=A0A8X7QG58_BRACI|nr:hypothetical protein Bca52824_063458 [Brassica carinata]